MPRTLLPMLLTAAAIAGCSSPPPESRPFKPSPDEPQAPIGVVITRLDGLLAQWNDAMLRPPTTRSLQLRSGLELEIAKQVKQRFPELRAQLEVSPVVRNREIVAAALGFVKEPEALNPLLSGLGDPAPGVRSNALLGIGQLGDKNTPVELIATQLDPDSPEAAQANAAFALKRLAGAGAKMDPALPALRTALKNKNPAVRVQACAALGLADDKVSVPDLIALLRDDRTLVSAAAANALGHIGDMSAAAPLVDALGSKDLAVREEARAALKRLNAGDDLGSEAGAWKRWLELRDLNRPTPASQPG